ncbi:MAG: diguanylate cyclase [Vulcanimicrobiaceae bacterium]
MGILVTGHPLAPTVLPLVFTVGMIVALGILNAILAAVLHDRVALWYAAAMLAFATYDLARLPLPGVPPMLALAAPAAFVLYLGLITVFARTLLDLPRVAPIGWRIVLVLYAAVVLSRLAYAIAPHALAHAGLFDALDPLVTTAFLLAVFGTNLAAWQHGNALARWSSVAFAGVVVGFALGLSGTYGVIARTPLSDLAVGFGVAWEAIFLSVALAYRIRDLRDRAASLEGERDAYAAAALHDPLTGIANRRAFEQRFDQEWRRAARTRTPLALAIIDIDEFKTYNDAFGHPQGDRVLVRVAHTIAETLRRSEDFVARYGGEEFVVLLPGAKREDAARVLDGVRMAVRGLGIGHPTTGAEIVTISAGVASLVPRSEARSRSLLAAADRALYAAKREGRDRIALARFGSRASVNAAGVRDR